MANKLIVTVTLEGGCVRDVVVFDPQGSIEYPEFELVIDDLDDDENENDNDEIILGF